MREFFLLDPSVIFLNHDSFGACPEEVFAVYQDWQRELERQPVEFLGRRADALLAEARRALADYLNVDADHLVYIPNATVGVNIVARSLATATTTCAIGTASMNIRPASLRIPRNTPARPAPDTSAAQRNHWQASHGAGS